MEEGELMFVNLVAPTNPLGYGVVGYNTLKHLYNAGHSVSYWPIGKPEWSGDPQTQRIIEDTVKNAMTYNVEAPSIRIWHQNHLDMFPGRGKRIGWPIFELDTFNEIELHHLENLDAVFVCSKWAEDVVRSSSSMTLQSDIPVHVVPLGVDPTIFYRDEEARKHRPYWTNDSTIFINIGKWEKRKGHNELLEAFNAAFEPDDDVELWMLNDNPFLRSNGGNEEWKRKYISSKMGSKIKILSRMNTQAELRALFNQVDFGVFPSHAEGWNLEILELMACGVPSIATNYSGHTEFLNNRNAFLVQPDGMESAQDGIWFHGNGNWCKFDINELIHSMRLAHTVKQSDSIALEFPDLNKTVNKFTWENTVKKIEEAL